MHPGKTVRQDCLEKNGLSITDAARVLGVDRQTLSNLLNAKSGISPEMAVRLEKAFGTPAREWLVVQPIAVNQAGTRIPAVERQCEKYLQAPGGTPALQPEQRSDLFVRAVEPTLQRELKHKGAVNGDGSYSAELIGYVEIAGRRRA